MTGQAVDQDAMKAFFDKFDTDANGTISFEERLGRIYVCFSRSFERLPNVTCGLILRYIWSLGTRVALLSEC